MEALLQQVETGTPGEAEAALGKLHQRVVESASASPFEARAVFEAGARYWVRQRKRAELERALVQLRPWGMSDEYAALEMLLFLVSSRLSDLFSALELMPVDARLRSKHVAFVVALERHLTEGSFGMVLHARKDQTSPLFGWLLEDLEHTVRDEIASCMEVAYHHMSLAKAASLLNLASPQAARDFAATRTGWIVVGDRLEFEAQKAAAAAHKAGLTSKSFPTDFVIRESLNVASDLDRIV